MSWAVVAHPFNPSTPRQRQVDLSEFETSLFYIASSRLVRNTYGDLVFEEEEKEPGEMAGQVKVLNCQADSPGIHTVEGENQLL